TLAKPEIVRSYAGFRWMDPGEPETRAQSLRVITDVVRRYDVDGVHIDDYFYPYPENDPATRRPAPFPDSASYARYITGGGTLARDDWRRANVDAFVHAMYDSVHAAKPWVKVGISPFGIYRPKEPANACCFDAYAKLYADSRRWWREGWADYLTPQLYWKIAARQQSYPELLAWWAAENRRGRNLWPGNYLSRVGTRPNDWRVAEIDSQIAVTRAQRGAGGNVWFSMQTFMRNTAGVADSLRVGPYAEPALVPASPWLPGRAPGAPSVVIARGGRPHVALEPAPGDVEPWLWVVQLREGERWDTVVLPGSAREYVPVRSAYAGGDVPGPDEVRAYGVDRTGREGPAGRAGAGVGVASGAAAGGR
ncbi:MAG TPA: family 10 glycosylhydrolase, partial [Gemmatirosa sp.]